MLFSKVSFENDDFVSGGWGTFQRRTVLPQLNFTKGKMHFCTFLVCVVHFSDFYMEPLSFTSYPNCVTHHLSSYVFPTFIVVD
jgi:hypothetical protein